MRKGQQDILMGIHHQNRIGNCCLLTDRRMRKLDAEALVASGHVARRECVVKVVVEVDETSGRATSIERISEQFD